MTDLKQYRLRASNAAELVEGVEAAVAGGAIAAGEPLPSVRHLAGDLGLSPATVASALAELRRRGVVVSEPRRGTRIGEGPPVGTARAPLPVPAGARDLSRGNPDARLLPDLRRVLRASPPQGRLYGEPPVLAGLAQLAREQLEADGIPGDQLCVVSGALDGIERTLEAHLRPGDAVAVENPGYAALFDLLRARGLELRPVAVDPRGMLPDELERALAQGAGAAIVTPRGQNPTGAALDAPRAGELRSVLARFPGVLVIEDDHLGPIADAPLHTVAGGRARWAATRSVAKALGPDLRLAVLAGDAHTVARVQGRQQCGPGWVSHILQRAVLALWSDERVLGQVERARAVYRERRSELLARLAERGVPASGACGLNVWVPVAEEASVVGGLLQRGWVLAPGAPYRLPGSEPGVRVTTSTLAPRESGVLAAALAEQLAPSRSARSG